MRWLIGAGCVLWGLGLCATAEAQEQLDMEFSMDESEAAESDGHESRPAFGGVGFQFGMSVQQVRAACAEGGHRLLRESRTQFRCTGTALAIPFEAKTVLGFEDGRLREIDVVIPLSERNRGVGRWARRYRRLRMSLEDKYGSSRPASIVAADCLQDDFTLARCVLDDRAHMSAHWHPTNGGLVSIHLLHVPHFGPALRVSYLSHYAHLQPPVSPSSTTANASFAHF